MFWRYRVHRSNALHLISSSESSSSWWLPSASAESYISSRGDFHMMSACSIASEPYTKKKGVCPVALLGWVRSPQITIGNSASHLPPFFLVESKILFFKPSIISPLMRSTWPLALGCAIDTYLISMLEFSQKSQNSCEVKFDPRSVMIVLGKPNLWSISLMNSTARSDEIF